MQNEAKKVEVATEVRPASTPFEIPDPEEITKERAIAKTIEDNFERSLLDRLDRYEQAEQVIRRRATMIRTALRLAISDTMPEGWVLNRLDDGSVLGIPRHSACATIANIFGVRLYDVRPIDSAGRFAPEVVSHPDGSYTLRAWTSARCVLTGNEIEILEAARRSIERFTGRTEEVVVGEKKTKVVFESDLRSAVLTLLRSKAVRVLVCSQVPESFLREVFSEVGKNADRCVKGHGFGSSSERAASRVTTEEVKKGASALGKEILARVGGDKEAAKALLREITANPAKDFPGFDSVERFTADWQIESARKKLSSHPTFGDQEKA
jgi:hypothetical protein